MKNTCILRFSRIILILLITLLFHSSCSKNDTSFDIIVYGGTSSGVIAAYSASMEGKSVLLIEPGNHLGGLTSGGLGKTDIGNKYAVNGLARDFYRRLGDHYGIFESWRFEPHIAEKIFNDYINESSVVLLKNHRLTSVDKNGTEIRSITVEKSSNPGKHSEKTYYAQFFIDCSYEGDLMAGAGVSYTIGRESNEKYNETYNGIQLREAHQFPDGIDPYKVTGEPSSGLCWGVADHDLAPQGSGDKLIQAYNYRLCLTTIKNNMIEITIPDTYDPAMYELLRRVMLKRESDKENHNLRNYLIISPMPNNKTDINNMGPFSTDAIGMNYQYPEGDYETRERIAKEIEEYIKGLLYFLGHDSAVPAHIKEEIRSFGWAADEFADNGHFPNQLYVRESRRLIGEYVMTDHDCMGKTTIKDGVGYGAYAMDSHNCQRLVVDGMVKNEGDIWIRGASYYPISYKSLTPKREECTNLIVPVCLSASHIAFGSIRMEPVFMVLGQSAAVACAIAIDEKKIIQEVDVKKMMAKLEKDPLQNGTPPDILVDNSDSSNVRIIGNWESRDVWMGQYKYDQIIHKPSDETAEVIFYPAIPGADRKYTAYVYAPYLPWSAHREGEYSEKVKIAVSIKGETDVREYDYKIDFVKLGTWVFNEGDYVKIIATGNDEIVRVDALLLVPDE